jgi:hypothetical protein
MINSIKAKKLQHNKIKNTGILFELLTRQMVMDVLSKKPAKDIISRNILTEFFSVGSELNKEYEIYNAITNLRSKDKQHIREVIHESIGYTKNIDLNKLRAEKYKLIKKISENFDTNTFFKTNIPNFKVLASIYKLLMINEEKNVIPAPGEISIITENVVNFVANFSPKAEEQFKLKSDDRYIRDKLAYKLMVEKFNDKYDSLKDEQKDILRIYIKNNTSSDILKEKLINTFNNAKKVLTENINKIDDDALKVKVNYVIKNIDKINSTINSGKIIRNNIINNSLLYTELADNLKQL